MLVEQRSIPKGILQELFEKKHLEMIQQCVVDFGGLAMVDRVLPEQQIRHERIHRVAQCRLASCGLLRMIG